MERELIVKKLSRFNFCDRRFFPYIEKVLARLPGEICQSVLDDLSFTMVSFEDAVGTFYPLPSEVKALIVLSGEVLKEPEFQIIHTIAHELAHKVIGKGESGLYEKEAEELLVKWGFQEEVQKVNYARTWLEGGGYKIGYEWASKQPDLSQFEEFYTEWDEGKLDEDRWEEFIMQRIRHRFWTKWDSYRKKANLPLMIFLKRSLTMVLLTKGLSLGSWAI